MLSINLTKFINFLIAGESAQMLTRKFASIAALIVASTALVAVPTSAQRGPGGPEQMIERLTRDLNLTAEQRQRVQAIRQQYEPQVQPRREQIRRLRQELMNLLVSNASESQIRAKRQQVEQLQQELNNLGFDQMLAIRQVLTPEQRQQLAQRMTQRHERLAR
jgi:Spy/CpxP family protein refolding chaperone